LANTVIQRLEAQVQSAHFCFPIFVQPGRQTQGFACETEEVYLFHHTTGTALLAFFFFLPLEDFIVFLLFNCY